jgi:hypothetical protein
VEGQGTSAAIIHYEFIDRSAKPGANYYRLKQIDFDGHFEYSKIVHVIGAKNQIQFRMSPNPTPDVLYVSFDQTIEKRMSLDVVGLDGKTFLHKEMQTGIDQYTMDCNHLPIGVYFLIVKENGMPFRTEKFIKQ